MGWLMTIPEALVTLLIVLPIGLLGAWLRRAVMRAYQHDLTGWLALSNGVLFGLAAATYRGPPPSYFTINAASVLALGSSLMAFLSLGALTLGRKGSPLLMGTLYCLLALPLIAVSVFVLFVLTWSNAHLDR